MSNFTVKCDNNSPNAVDFCIFHKFRNEPRNVVISQSVVWINKFCNSKTSTKFTWEDMPFFTAGKWQTGSKQPPFNFSLISEADSSDIKKNSIILNKIDNKYEFENIISKILKDTLCIYTDRTVVKREYFVGLAMKAQCESAVSIIFEAQPNLCYEFNPVIDYYITYAKKYEQGKLIDSLDEKNAFKLRFPSNNIIVTLRNDNTFALRPNTEDDL